MSIPFAAVEFTEDGTAADPAQVEAALHMVRHHRPADVLLLSHGWNNDMASARQLYRELIDGLQSRLPPGAADRLAVIGVFWPSIKWADEDQIAGGGVAVGDEQGRLLDAIDQAVADPAAAGRLKQLAADLSSADARADFLALVRGLLPPDTAPDDADEDPAPSLLMAGDADEVFTAVSDAAAGFEDLTMPGPAPEAGEDAPGVAPDLLAHDDAVGAGLFGMSWSSLARQVLNTFTYYTMKSRAGDVGAKGVAALVARIHADAPDVGIHLAGHSFGARVMSAAAAAATVPVDSLTLLQGAFSHYGFTRNYAGTGKDGAFAAAIADGRLAGPLVITHTHNDKAVGLAYAIASRLARQSGAGIGDAADFYGGIGANGSVGTAAAAVRMGDGSSSYTFNPGTITNVLADDHISGHSDVTNPAVINVLAHAIGAATGAPAAVPAGTPAGPQPAG
jgi:hypothetical protein